MNFVLERVSEPEIEPVTLEEMRKHLRCFADQTSDNGLIESLITAAREWVEGYTGRTLIDTTYRLTVSDWVPPSRTGAAKATGIPLPQDGIPLYRSPVIEIVSVNTVDSDGVETEIEDYQLREADSKWPRIIGIQAATTLRIVFRAGFSDQTSSPQDEVDVVPAVFKHAIKLIVANYYEQREPVNIGNITTELPMSVKWLLQSQISHLQIA